MSQNVEKPRKPVYTFETATRASRGVIRIGPWECEDRDLTRAQRRKILNEHVSDEKKVINDTEWSNILATHINEIALERPDPKVTADLVDATFTEVEFFELLKRVFPSILG